MSELQKAFQSLQPYLLGIRYLEVMPIIDVQFREGWFLPESKYVIKTKIDGEDNHFMLYSENKDIGLDDLLQYLEITIKANIEREKKTQLLKIKGRELQELFKNTPLKKLERLKFTFEDEDIIDMVINDVPPEEEIPVVIQPPANLQPMPVAPLTEDEKEMIEEEKRAENHKKLKELQATKKFKSPASKVELPPKVLATVDQECDCGPDEFCTKCMEAKSL